MPIPDPSAPQTLRLIQRISPNERPFRVEIQPVEWARELYCTETVPRLVRENGGECVLGWALWIWPNVLIEGEFHAVWRKPDGTFVDPTPRKDGEPVVLFLPDPAAVIDRWQKDNVRMPLQHRREILDFIEIEERIHRETNRGSEAQSSEFTVTPLFEHLKDEERRIFQRLVRRFGPPPEP
jgi:hypothetical protein